MDIVGIDIAKAKFDVARWREFRWQHRGEAEVDIWKRIKQQHLVHHPWWYPFLPFWRPVSVEERNASRPVTLYDKDQQLIMVSCFYMAEKVLSTVWRSSLRSIYGMK